MAVHPTVEVHNLLAPFLNEHRPPPGNHGPEEGEQQADGSDDGADLLVIKHASRLTLVLRSEIRHGHRDEGALKQGEEGRVVPKLRQIMSEVLAGELIDLEFPVIHSGQRRGIKSVGPAAPATILEQFALALCVSLNLF
ncbi:MAG: hypothetical protein ACLP9N_22645 [Mycobacterium sp.]